MKMSEYANDVDGLEVLSDRPGLIVFGLEGHDIHLDEDKGYCRTGSVPITIRAFPRDKYEWVRNFTLGHDPESGYWAYGRAAMITAEPTARTISLGFELGDTIRIEGRTFTIEPDHNHNIKLTEVTS